MDAIREHAAAEADAIREQQLKLTQSESSSSAQRPVRGREDTASSPGTAQLFITCRTTNDEKLVSAWDKAREDVFVTMEISETLGYKCTQSERGEFWVVKHASESNVLASFPAPFRAPGNEATNIPAEWMQVNCLVSYI